MSAIFRRLRPDPLPPPPPPHGPARMGVVKWYDAHQDTGWLTSAEWQDIPPRTIVSVAWVLTAREAKAEHITIAQDWDAESQRWNGVTHVPYGMLVSIRFLD